MFTCLPTLFLLLCGTPCCVQPLLGWKRDAIGPSLHLVAIDCVTSFAPPCRVNNLDEYPKYRNTNLKRAGEEIN